MPETFHALPVSVREPVRECAVIRGQIFDACDVTTLSGEEHLRYQGLSNLCSGLLRSFVFIIVVRMELFFFSCTLVQITYGANLFARAEDATNLKSQSTTEVTLETSMTTKPGR